MPSTESVLRKVFIIATLVGVAVVGYLVLIQFLPNPATITPSTTTIDVGQSTFIGVGWKGGAAPYIVTLYSSSTAGCNSTSNVAGEKSSLTQPQFIFTVSPTTTTHYCGVVSSSAATSAFSPTIVITVNPALGAPTLVLSPPGMDTGQSGTVKASVTATGGSAPYTIALYSGSTNICSAATTLVAVSAGTNPVTGLASSSTEFSFASPSAATFYCATVKDNPPASTPIASTAVKFSINPALTATISPPAPKLDSGQSITLNAVANQGTPPYSYQWYTGLTCVTPIAGQNESSYSTGSLTSTTQYSVSVGDASTGTPTAKICAKATATVSSAFTDTPVTIGPSILIDSGQVVSLTVSWESAGTLPYAVKITTSPSANCASPTPTGLNMTHVTVTTAVFQVFPSASTFYCATVTDGATSPEKTSTTSAAVITVNPTLTPRVVLVPSAIDSGQTASLTATVSLSGGTPPYTVTLFSGTSNSCASDTTIVVSTQPNPQVGIPGPTATFTLPAPSANTYFCARVTDSPTVPVTTTSPPALFAVNGVLSATISPASPSGATGSSVSLTGVPSGGTSPFIYQWYTGSTCALVNLIAGQTSAVYPTGPLGAPGVLHFSVLVKDSSVGVPAQSFCASTALTVTPPLVPTLSLFPPGMDVGQSTVVTATVSWTGGTSPYTVTLYSGSSPTCSADTTVVTVTSPPNPRPGLAGPSIALTFQGPTASTYYCAKVVDTASTPASVSTPTFQFTVNPLLSKLAIALSLSALDSGQATTVTATVSWSGGTAPYTVTLYSGSNTNCASDTVVVAVSSGTNPKTGVTGTSTTFPFNAPGSTTYYCASVVESTISAAPGITPTALLTVNPVLTPNPPVLTPVVLDSGQSATVTAAVTWTGGTSPVTVTLRSGPSASCSSDTTTVAVILGSNPQTGLTGTSASFSFASPGTSTFYCISVKDTSAIPVTALSDTSMFTINPALSASLAPMFPTAIDTGQTITVTATISWTGGTSSYTVALFSGLNPICSLNTTPAGSPKANLIAFSTTITFTSPVSTTYYCAKVTDSSGTPSTFTTNSVQFIVNPSPTAAITPPAPSIGPGQTSPPLTVTASSGTPPFTYQWYTGSTCTSAILGQTLPVYLPGVLSTTSVFSVKATDSSPGSPANLATACASVVVTVGHGPEGIAANPATGMIYVADPLTNHVSVIDSFSNTVVTTIAVGTLPWGVAVDNVNDLIYVTNYGSGTVSIIDGLTNALCAPTRCVTGTIIVGNNPQGIGLNLVLREAYVANSGSNTVSVINMTTDLVVATVAVGSSPQSVAVGPAPPISPPFAPPFTVFVTNYGSNTVSVISITSPYLSYPVTTITVGSNPWGVAVNPLTNLVYVTNSGSATVSVLNGSTFATVATISLPAGSNPEGIAVNPSSSRAYVALSATNNVAVINILTNTVISSGSPQVPIPAGTNPWGVALLSPSFSPSFPNLGYVTNSGGNTVTVINIATNQVVVTIIVT